jgi:uncharacterized membrane protein
MHEIFAHWFAAVCGQDPGHTWAPGGILLPCCQRCTGLYPGAGVAALLHLWLRPRLSGRFLEIHGAFLLVMIPLGFHWITQGPVLRTISGVLFGFGVVTFLWLPLSRTMEEWKGKSGVRIPKSEGNPKGDIWKGRQQLPEVGASEKGVWRLRASDFCRHKLTQRHDGKSYFLVVTAMLLLAPAAAILGEAATAYGLSILAGCGALALVALVIGNVMLGLLGALRLVGRLVQTDLEP